MMGNSWATASFTVGLRTGAQVALGSGILEQEQIPCAINTGNRVPNLKGVNDNMQGAVDTNSSWNWRVTNQQPALWRGETVRYMSISYVKINVFILLICFRLSENMATGGMGYNAGTLVNTKIATLFPSNMGLYKC